VIRQARGALGEDPFGYRAEFLSLVHKAKVRAGCEVANRTVRRRTRQRTVAQDARCSRIEHKIARCEVFVCFRCATACSNFSPSTSRGSISNDTHKQHHTYGDYLTWPDHPRQELIDGVAYVREPPAPSPCHQEMVGELFGQLWVALKGRPCRVYVAPFDVACPNPTRRMS